MRNTTLYLILVFLCSLQVSSQKCPDLDDPKGGKVRIRGRGKLAKFRCWRKFKLLGPKILVCNNDQWSLPPPVCIRNGCDEIQPTINLTITSSYNGALIEFDCKPPYKLMGVKSVYCDGKSWSDSAPVCGYVEPEEFCDFENKDICGWRHDPLGNLEWKWNAGTTPTRNTGPKYDHSLGKGENGHYMFMETSSPIKKNDEARLMSPYYKPTTETKCFEFWYHMFGAIGSSQVGNLKVYTEEKNTPGSKKLEFSESGNKGDAWLKGDFRIGKRNRSFRIIIEAEKMDSYLSDISVDDVRLYNCSDESTTRLDETTIADETTTSFKTSESVIFTSALKETTEIPTSVKTTLGSTFQEWKVSTTKSDVPTLSTKTTYPSSSSTAAPNSSSNTTWTTSIGKSVNQTMLPIKSSSASTSLTTPMTTVTTTKSKTTMAVTTPATLSTTRERTRTTTQTLTPTSEKKTKETTVLTPSITKVSTKRSTAGTPSAKTTSLNSKGTKVTTYATTALKTGLTMSPATDKQNSNSTTKPVIITSTTRSSTSLSTNLKTSPSISVKTMKPTSTAVLTRQTKLVEPTTVSNLPISTTKSYQISVLTDVPVNSSPSYVTDSTTQQYKITVTFKNNNNTSVSNFTITGSETIERTKSDSTPIKPLLIGVGVGVAIGLIIVFAAIYIYLKKKRKNHIFEDEMEPIAKNAVYD